jgi:hypothetical protein
MGTKRIKLSWKDKKKLHDRMLLDEQKKQIKANERFPVVVEDPPHLAQRRRMVLLMTEKEMNTTKETYPDLVVRKATKQDSITDVQLPGCDAPAGGRLLQADENTTATDSGH